jgi:BirA family biotin operon repressor/biotin-[acetyl-CoA-carboxylase] ligase
VSWDGLDEAGVRALTGASRVVLAESVPSVLDVLHALAADGAPAGTLVLAEEQTGGRGRAGRAWYSPRGAGIWMALLFRPKEPPLGGALGIRAGLALIAALRERERVLPVALKWPNDVVMHDRKAGGILCEARWLGPRLGWIAAGIGLNVSGPVDERVAETAVALDSVDDTLTRREVLKALVPRLLDIDRQPPALSPEERVQFLRRQFVPPGSGTVVGLEPDGALMLRRTNGSLERRTIPE